MRVTSKQGQWLGDIAVRESGDIASIIEMAINNDVSVTEVLTVGSTLLKPSPINKRIMNYYKTNNIYPATATTMEHRPFGGIGFMAVGITFIVS